ncbi:MAG: magnesium transporter [Alphaproteobacteria bacterium]|nr:magnesium transporter [Alphaproteobacteria bacterium]
MGEPAPLAPVEAGSPSDDVGLDPAVVEAVDAALAAGDHGAARRTALELHYSELADLFEALPHERRIELVDLLRPTFPAAVFAELDENVRDDVAERLGTEDLARTIANLDTDDALYLIDGLGETRRGQVFNAIPRAIRAQLEEQLAFPPESAGRLMQRDVVAVPAHWDVGRCIDHLRESGDLPDDFYDLFVVDSRHRPVGWVPLDRFVRAKRPVKIAAILDSDLEAIPVDMDQEAVARLFKDRDLTSAPVVDAGGRLIGTITIDDVVDVIEEQAEEDMMRLSGVVGSDVHSSVLETARLRSVWLLLNLCTAFLAASVIDLFSAAIDRVVALAVLMPICASLGGNAGTQALTVAVRAIATGTLSTANAARIVLKEGIVGGLNGFAFAIVTGTAAWLWFHDPRIGLCIALAMTANLVVAGVAGVTIPVVLNRVGVDPAVSSSVILTAMTDTLGFFMFLGLATLIIL